MKRKTKKRLILAGALVLVALAVTAIELVFSGPRMLRQDNLRHQQWAAPLPPEGAVHAGQPAPGGKPVRSADPSDSLAMAVGNAWYHYACIQCHGERGDGRGPVGVSYVPAPADLSSPRVQAMDDAALLHASLTGPGHEPVLNRLLPEQDRDDLLLYLRTLPDRHAP